MHREDKSGYRLAASDAVPPTSSSYWVVPGLLLAGAYPGDPDPEEHRTKLQALLAAGIRTFVNLMEATETNYGGQPFVTYDGLVGECCPDAACLRFPIRDLSVPTAAQMTAILDALDESMAAGRAAYVHCWGGVGRTGTVIGCWLLRHRLATADNFIRVLDALRQQDRVRWHRVSPETPAQQRFVKKWNERGHA